eukprot:6146953-Pyramimonas_sp.AAC.1
MDALDEAARDGEGVQFKKLPSWARPIVVLERMERWKIQSQLARADAQKKTKVQSGLNVGAAEYRGGFDYRVGASSAAFSNNPGGSKVGATDYAPPPCNRHAGGEFGSADSASWSAGYDLEADNLYYGPSDDDDNDDSYCDEGGSLGDALLCRSASGGFAGVAAAGVRRLNIGAAEYVPPSSYDEFGSDDDDGGAALPLKYGDSIWGQYEYDAFGNLVFINDNTLT